MTKLSIELRVCQEYQAKPLVIIESVCYHMSMCSEVASMNPNSEITTSRESELSGQSQRLLVLASEGKTDKEIAHEMSLSIHTVDYHWRNIRHRYGLISRTAIVAKFVNAKGDDHSDAHAPSEHWAQLRSWPQ